MIPGKAFRLLDICCPITSMWSFYVIFSVLYDSLCFVMSLSWRRFQRLLGKFGFMESWYHKLSVCTCLNKEKNWLFCRTGTRRRITVKEELPLRMNKKIKDNQFRKKLLLESLNLYYQCYVLICTFSDAAAHYKSYQLYQWFIIVS